MADNKTIIVTGCTKGIGYAICTFFASNGFNVAGCARTAASVSKMQQAFEKAYPGGRFHFGAVNISDKKALQGFAGDCLQRFKKVDILVNNAGAFIPGTIKNEHDGVLEELLAANLTGAYHFTRALLPAFIRQQSGSIFNMCSVASLKAYPNGGSYCISKFALLGFSKQLREELKADHIKVTAIIPGATLTDSWKNIELPPERFVKAEDIAQTIFNIYHLSGSTDVEEIILRPQLGDI